MTLLQIETVTNQASYFAVKAKEMAIEYAPKLVGAILVYIIGSWIIKKLTGLLNKVFQKRNYDASLRTFYRL
ncbi:hypothetical protein LWM68_26040 [Niabella sp. W65]|nr:hypothetical protein [Niabella sp. W65]MCH7365923.1 hypothetical protein [Niabella sp. W65]ULT41670.1 hypothetical protein KRR40_44970 [Niabella sp. I65]